MRIHGRWIEEVVAMSRLMKLMELKERRCFLRSASSFGDSFMWFRWAALWVGLIAVAPFAWSQQPQLHREIPEDAFATRGLIVWSGVQKPQPTPQPLPAPDNQTPQPDQPPDQQSKPPADPQTQQTPARSFPGRIAKDRDRYVLQAAGNTTYELDEQTGVQQYENQNVHIVGKLDAASNTIHIVKLALMF